MQHSVDYETYAKVVASLDPQRVVAFDFPLPSFLKKLKSDLQEVGQLLKDTAKVGWSEVVKAFQDKSVFHLLKAVGFSVVKLAKAVQAAAALPINTIFNALEDLASTFGSAEALKKMQVKERIAKLDAGIHRHPILAKLTGVAVAGLLVFMFFRASASGDVKRDFDIADAIVDSLKGHFDLAELLASKDGVRDIALLLFGVASGGLGITAYGIPKAAAFFKFLGSHGETAINILVALFYSAAKRVGLKVSMPEQLHANRTQDWFHRLRHEDKVKYKKKWPGTKFVHKQPLVQSFTVTPGDPTLDRALMLDVMARFAKRHKGYEQVGKIGDHVVWAGFNGRENDYLVTDSTTLVAFIRMYEEDPKQVQHSYTSPDYIGKGIEARLYDLVLKREQLLRSADAMDPRTSYIWKQLVTRYKGWLSIPSHLAKVHIIDWEQDNGAVWPVVICHGKRISLPRLTELATNPTDMLALCTCHYEIRR